MHTREKLSFVIAFLLIWPGTAVAQQNATGIGTQYGTRDPITCGSKTEPRNGALTREQAILYVACGMEGVGVLDEITIIDVKSYVSIEIGTGHLITNYDKGYFTDIDVIHPIYPIHGSFVSAQCRKLRSMSDIGRNCCWRIQENAKGYCFRTTFGEWSCYMEDYNAKSKCGLPPPE